MFSGTNEGFTFFQPVAAPVLALPLGPHLLLESRADLRGFYQQNNETGPFHGSFTATLEYLQAHAPAVQTMAHWCEAIFIQHRSSTSTTPPSFPHSDRQASFKQVAPQAIASTCICQVVAWRLAVRLSASYKARRLKKHIATQPSKRHAAG